MSDIPALGPCIAQEESNEKGTAAVTCVPSTSQIVLLNPNVAVAQGAGIRDDAGSGPGHSSSLPFEGYSVTMGAIPPELSDDAILSQNLAYVPAADIEIICDAGVMEFTQACPARLARNGGTDPKLITCCKVKYLRHFLDMDLPQIRSFLLDTFGYDIGDQVLDRVLAHRCLNWQDYLNDYEACRAAAQSPTPP